MLFYNVQYQITVVQDPSVVWSTREELTCRDFSREKSQLILFYQKYFELENVMSKKVLYLEMNITLFYCFL